MSQQAAYNRIASEYDAFVSTGLTNPTSVLAVATRALLDTFGDVRGLTICDLACGEGHLTRRLAQEAYRVVGVDISESLINIARQKELPSNLQFVVDDAQLLTSQLECSFDWVVCNLALMDIPDLEAVYSAVYRVLRQTGHFTFSITHPCFQAPHADVDADADGNFLARRVSRYSQEGFWRSKNLEGIRGKVGAFHRTLSTYLNTLMNIGFRVNRLAEPTLPIGKYADPYVMSQVEVPAILIVDAVK
jgi:ubiquinone/menaquinone biosynthesis C-methylase UbiE